MYDERASRRLTRLAKRWHAADDDDERDAIFTRILEIVMTMPVVGAAKARTAACVGGHVAVYADDEDAAIRRAAFRSLRRWDPDAGVPFGPYLTRGLAVAIHDFWRTIIRTTLCVYVPTAEWIRWRHEETMRAYGSDVESDPLLDSACRCGSFWESPLAADAAYAWDEWKDVWEDDDGSL